MDYLNGIIESDFDDAMIAGISEEELNGLIEAAPASTKKKLIKKIQKTAKQGVASMSENSRGEFARRMSQLPDSMRKGLASKTLQAVDAAYYGIKIGSGIASIKMFRDDDNKVVGLTNLSSAKLEKGNVLLLDRIILLAGVSSVTSGTELEKATGCVFMELSSEHLMGQLELKANGSTVLKDLSLEVFNTMSRSNVQKGCLKLDNPKMIFDQQAIEANLEFSKPLPPNTWIKIVLLGTQVVRN